MSSFQPTSLDVLWVCISHPCHAASILCYIVFHTAKGPTKASLHHDYLKDRYPSSKLVTCGNFNKLNTIELQHGLHLHQVVHFPIHGNRTRSHPDRPARSLQLSRRRSDAANTSPSCGYPWPLSCSPCTTITNTYRPLQHSSILHCGNWTVCYSWVEALTEADIEAK